MALNLSNALKKWDEILRRFFERIMSEVKCHFVSLLSADSSPGMQTGGSRKLRRASRHANLKFKQLTVRAAGSVRLCPLSAEKAAGIVSLVGNSVFDDDEVVPPRERPILLNTSSPEN
jgi:phytoene dehydrogenase-like protein